MPFWLKHVSQKHFIAVRRPSQQSPAKPLFALLLASLAPVTADMRDAKKAWWVCRCGSWAWADHAACPSCGAAPSAATAKWLASLPAKGCARRGAANTAKGVDGHSPRTVTVGDFTLVVGKGKKAQRKARREMQQLQELAAEAMAAKGSTAASAARHGSAVHHPSEEPEAMQAEPTALQAMADAELELALKALGKAGLPGREDYLAEQQRRKEAKLAAKPAWVKVKAVEAKWRKAQAKTAKAEAASQSAAAAVEIARAAFAKAEAAAVDAGRLLAEAKEEEASAKAEVDWPGPAVEKPSAESAAAWMPGLLHLPGEYTQRPDVAEKLQRMGVLLQEVLAGASPERAGEAREAPAAAPAPGAAGCPAFGHGRRSRELDRGENRAASVPAARDGLWAAANAGPLRSRSPIRDGRYAGRRQAGS